MDDVRLSRRSLLEGLEIEEFPLEVVPDWDVLLDQANERCRLIDRHLDYEARGRAPWERDRLSPAALCPEQRVQLVSDLYGVRR